jgi:3-amino-4-hydroxybenzoic acid synthase
MPGSGREKFAWFDARGVPGELMPDLEGALSRHAYSGLLLTPDQARSTSTPLRRLGIVEGGGAGLAPQEVASLYDLVLLELTLFERCAQSFRDAGKEVGLFVDVTGHDSLERGCARLSDVGHALFRFRDETKIPLEIVLARAEPHGTQVVTCVGDSVEADVVLGVLEMGSHGVLFGSLEQDQLIRVADTVADRARETAVPLVRLTMTGSRHVGMGDRACIDTCSHLGLDEGVVVGSFARGGVLVCSETHALPYMPTRPFRVNAGAIHSYAVAPDDRTWYLSDLRAGMPLLAVRTDGRTRRIVIGRVKIERRPLIQLQFEAEDGQTIELMAQEDWHVRVFGAEPSPRNVTSLRRGDQVLGLLLRQARHVGLPITEWMLEQ